MRFDVFEGRVVLVFGSMGRGFLSCDVVRRDGADEEVPCLFFLFVVVIGFERVLKKNRMSVQSYNPSL